MTEMHMYWGLRLAGTKLKLGVWPTSATQVKEQCDGTFETVFVNGQNSDNEAGRPLNGAFEAVERGA